MTFTFFTLCKANPTSDEVQLSFDLRWSQSVDSGRYRDYIPLSNLVVAEGKVAAEMVHFNSVCDRFLRDSLRIILLLLSCPPADLPRT